MNFKNINHQNMSNIILDQITKNIIHGELCSGDRLPTEKNLEILLGVGRSTVREALKPLETLGIIEKRKSGTVVTEPKTETLANLILCFVALKNIDSRQLYELRAIIEPHIALLAAQRRTQEGIEELKKILQRTNAMNVSERASANVDFHQCIVSLTQNEAIIFFYSLIQPGFYRSQQTTLNTEIALSGTAYQEHFELVEAIKEKDSQRAYLIMERHVRKLIPFLPSTDSYKSDFEDPLSIF